MGQYNQVRVFFNWSLQGCLRQKAKDSELVGSLQIPVMVRGLLVAVRKEEYRGAHILPYLVADAEMGVIGQQFPSPEKGNEGS